MHPIVHAEIGWLTGLRLQSLRDRRLVVLAGIAPDLDGLTILAGNDAYGKWHHLVFHGVLAALLTAGVCGALARRRWAVALLSFAAFHLHLFCDILGSGPEWPIAYLWPLSDAFYGWKGGWELVSWQNTVIGMGVTLVCLSASLWAGCTFTEVLSTAADRRVVAALRARFRRPPMGEPSE